MTRNTKWILGILAGVLLTCVCACGVGVFAFGRFASTAVVEDVTAVRNMRAEIADYALPAGFDEGTGMNMLIVKMLIHQRVSDRSMLMMMALPTAGDPEQMQRSFAQGMQRGNAQNVRWESSRSVPLTVAGKRVDAIEQIGVLDGGQRVKALTFGFQGGKGLGACLLMVPEGSWTQAEIDAFVASIR